MDTDPGSIEGRLARAERTIEELAARLFVASSAVDFIFTTFEVSRSDDSKMVLRSAMLRSLQDAVDDAGFGDAGKSAAAGELLKLSHGAKPAPKPASSD